MAQVILVVERMTTEALWLKARQAMARLDPDQASPVMGRGRAQAWTALRDVLRELESRGRQGHLDL